MKTIIVAAGQGIRLWDESDRIPKTLLPYQDGTVLSHILANFRGIGVSEFVIVVGYRADMILDYLDVHEFFGHQITFVENTEWRRGNGVSVLAAASEVPEGESALLSMSDHLVPVDALNRLVSGEEQRNTLLTDPRITEIFDIDDATKVVLKGDEIVEIGKTLATYNAVDCGVFRVTPSFFRALKSQIDQGKEGISDGARQLIATEGFHSVSIPDECRWIDIDTPESYRHALGNLSVFGGDGSIAVSPTPDAGR